MSTETSLPAPATSGRSPTRTNSREIDLLLVIYLAVIVLSILGSIAAMVLQRYVIIVATAFGGAWTVIVGGLAIAGDRGATNAAAAGNVWILYPTSPAPGQKWVPVAWILLGLVGTGLQLGITGRKRK